MDIRASYKSAAFDFVRRQVPAKRRLLLLVAGTCLSCAALPARADITVGVILSLTGPGASLGAPANETVKLWPHMIGSEKLNVIVIDDGSDSTRAAIAARKLTTEDHADVLIGSSVTPPSLAIVNVIGETMTPLLSLAGGGAIVDPPTGPRHWSFKLSPPEPIAVDLALEHMKKMKVTTLGIISLSNSYGDGFLKAMVARAPTKGITVVSTEQYSPNDQSTVGQIAKVMSAKPDAIYIAASGTPGALPELELAARGYKGLIYQTQGVANIDFLRVGGKAVEGTYVTLSPMMVAEQLSEANPIRKVAVNYVSQFEAKNGANTRSPFGATAWDMMLVLTHASEEALKVAHPGTPEFRSALRDNIEGLKNFVTSEGVINMSPTDHNGVDQTCQVLVRIEGGTWKLAQ